MEVTGAAGAGCTLCSLTGPGHLCLTEDESCSQICSETHSFMFPVCHYLPYAIIDPRETSDWVIQLLKKGVRGRERETWAPVGFLPLPPWQQAQLLCTQIILMQAPYVTRFPTGGTSDN